MSLYLKSFMSEAYEGIVEKSWKKCLEKKWRDFPGRKRPPRK
jgi:hypothetical protein